MLKSDERFESLAAELRSRGIFVGIEGIVMNGVETAYVTWRNERYEINIPYHWSPEQRYGALCHELSHIVRGDVNRCVKEFKARSEAVEDDEKPFDPDVWNIASDSQINRGLIEKILSTLEGLDIITYEKLREKVDELPMIAPSTQAIYDILVEMKDKQREALQQLIDSLSDHIGEGDDSRDPTEVDRAKAAVNIRNAAKEVNDDSLERSISDAIDGKKVKVSSKGYEAKTVASIDSLIKMVKGFSKDRRFSRTWMMPSFLGHDSRGVAYMPKAHVVILIDTSGSMQSFKPVMFGIAKALKHSHDLTFILHHTQPYYISTKLTDEWESGGTSFIPSYRAINSLSSKVDLVVHLTDNETNDRKEAYDLATCPVITSECPSFKPIKISKKEIS